MKLTNTLVLCFAAAMVWNCNDASTTPETASVDPRIPNTVNSISEYAAITAGYQITSQAAALPDTNEGAFGPDMFKAFADAGICQNFVLILEELLSNVQGGGQSVDPFAASPRLRNVATCLEKKAQGFSTGAEPSESQVLSLIDDCFCAGSGTLFGNFAFSKYAPPEFSGYGTPVVSGTTYAAPTISGYSAPAVPGKGYAPPGL
jgi:hypothetical protein